MLTTETLMMIMDLGLRRSSKSNGLLAEVQLEP